MANKYEFMVNLRSNTGSSFFAQALSPDGYLVSPAGVTGTTRKLAERLVEEGQKVFVDNGNFSLIGDLAAKYKVKAEAVCRRIYEHENQLGRKPLRAEVDEASIDAATKLAMEVQADIKCSADSDPDIWQRQGSIKATRFIGCEDITMAVWLALNLEPEFLNITRDTYRSMNCGVAERAAAQTAVLPPETASNYYPVASAVSYDTAYDAGLEFAAAGIKHAAMGFGAYTADDNYCDVVCIQNKVRVLPCSMPNRYIRTALVARGFWDGYRSIGGQSPEAFHFLGLGMPVMMAIAALAARDTKWVTFDATSPIRDAVEGTLYVSKPAYLKIRIRNAALRLANDASARWDCGCPFCAQFMKRYPFDYCHGFKQWRNSGKVKVDNQDLNPGGLLYQSYPLFSEPDRGRFRTDVNFARMGHNHWVLAGMTKGLTAAAARQGGLEEFVNKVVRDYANNTNVDNFAKTVLLSHKIMSIPNIGDLLESG